MPRFLPLLLLMLIAACGRPLTGPEEAVVGDLFGSSLDTAQIRVVGDAPLRSFTVNLPPRPRVTCQEQIVPARTGTVRVTPAGLVAFNTLFLSENWTLDDFAPAYPRAVSLYEVMFFAHEMTHVWQWQNREITGYHPLKAAAEHLASDDPYLFDPDTQQPFLDYGYEQQASLVEEYVCCAMLDPEGGRTARLKALISQAMPVRGLPRSDVFVAWPDAPRSGLCT
ncbi:MAG: hypothetical protein AAFY97_10745 [Pseudomonadota bacterium]